jgi:hypothetical protein
MSRSLSSRSSVISLCIMMQIHVLCFLASIHFQSRASMSSVSTCAITSRLDCRNLFLLRYSTFYFVVLYFLFQFCQRLVLSISARCRSYVQRSLSPAVLVRGCQIFLSSSGSLIHRVPVLSYSCLHRPDSVFLEFWKCYTITVSS